MSIPKTIMFIGTSRQATSCLMVLSEQRYQTLGLLNLLQRLVMEMLLLLKLLELLGIWLQNTYVMVLPPQKVMFMHLGLSFLN
ncbi:hypothetical protein BHE74_00016440 [Ensete ventricosum]|uniref:Uncharacterized protein n=1 Tax=Ensete ventricosum TaxID=4639 RepID=A0A427B0U1_ENSVE|nr:hypothetical protein B296_00012362 [Ensete ventricosum]RWW27068.1 hypothetical protein GW17_00008511 [Ensete ventricosum]RWW75553.1 hypothetical protein BHE74_00016440 [Ensete ventricosum]RZR96437.1 hypothetical protein BHM03_00025454 [Ensete ventricosum]